jgi:uncharacterized membrane protein
MEELFRHWAGYLALMVEALAVTFIAGAAIEAVWTMIKTPRQGRRRAVWVRFGSWLLLSLEFELGADIIRTAISPTWTQIGQLGAIAVIRTFLNHFLEQDLEKYTAEVSTAARVGQIVDDAAA